MYVSRMAIKPHQMYNNKQEITIYVLGMKCVVDDDYM